MRPCRAFVKLDDGRLGIRPELGGRSAEGIGGLERMTSLDAPAAAAAMTDVHVEAAMDRPTGDLDLILRGDVRRLDGAATARAGAG